MFYAVSVLSVENRSWFCLGDSVLGVFAEDDLSECRLLRLRVSVGGVYVFLREAEA